MNKDKVAVATAAAAIDLGATIVKGLIGGELTKSSKHDIDTLMSAAINSKLEEVVK